MRKPIVAGNWKMNLKVSDACHLVSELLPDLISISGVDKVLCPPFTSLMAISEQIKGKDIGLGAQNLYWEPFGAFTGEIAPNMVAEFCQYVIIGHSERRAYFGDTNETVRRKVKAALGEGLTPIICVGETLEENQASRTNEVVSSQVKVAVDGLDPNAFKALIFAYEPVWAIGTGLPATPEGANQVIAESIRGSLTNMFGTENAQAVRVQYGGSVKPENAREFFRQPDVDGALVGGASLKAADFVEIVRAAVP